MAQTFKPYDAQSNFVLPLNLTHGVIKHDLNEELLTVNQVLFRQRVKNHLVPRLHVISDSGLMVLGNPPHLFLLLETVVVPDAPVRQHTRHVGVALVSFFVVKLAGLKLLPLALDPLFVVLNRGAKIIQILTVLVEEGCKRIVIGRIFYLRQLFGEPLQKRFVPVFLRVSFVELGSSQKPANLCFHASNFYIFTRAGLSSRNCLRWLAQ